MEGVKWIKLSTDMFDNEKIVLIEGEEGGHEVLVTWVKLLCLAGKHHPDGVFRLCGTPHTVCQLAKILRMEESALAAALETLRRYGMIETADGVVTIVNWNKHQSLLQQDDQRQRERTRKAEYRRRKQLESAAVCEQVIAHMNTVCGTAFDAHSTRTVAIIGQRLQEGASVGEMLCVIDKKAAEWRGTPYQRFLRPQTLFGEKFEEYLHAPSAPKETTKTSEYAQFMRQLADQREEESDGFQK